MKAAEANHLIGFQTHDVEVQIAKLLAKAFLIEHAEHGVFAVNRGHD